MGSKFDVTVKNSTLHNGSVTRKFVKLSSGDTINLILKTRKTLPFATTSITVTDRETGRVTKH